MGKREKVREDEGVGGSTAWDRSCWKTGRREQGNWWKGLSAGKSKRKGENRGDFSSPSTTWGPYHLRPLTPEHGVHNLGASDPANTLQDPAQPGPSWHRAHAPMFSERRYSHPLGNLGFHGHPLQVPPMPPGNFGTFMVLCLQKSPKNLLWSVLWASLPALPARKTDRTTPAS